MISARRRQDLSVIVLWIVVMLLFVAAVVPWFHFNFPTQTVNATNDPTGLTWQTSQPPEVVVMAIPAVAIVLALLASSRPEIRVYVVLSSLIFGVIFAKLLQAHALIGLPWHLHPTVRPSAGYWLVAISLVLIGVSVLLALSSASVRVERPNRTA